MGERALPARPVRGLAGGRRFRTFREGSVHAEARVGAVAICALCACGSGGTGAAAGASPAPARPSLVKGGFAFYAPSGGMAPDV
jgi:hypothetical protein